MPVTNFFANEPTPTRASGFTLVELCVVIIILGTVIALVSTGYQSWQAQKRVETNQERIASASEKIHEYRKIRGFYPQPASLTAPRSDATYGQALDKQASPTPPSAAGSCTNGICRQDGVGGRNVLIGTIPFRELNIPEEEAYDVYGARIVYAVTENATEDEFKENEGALRVLNEKGENLFPDGTGHFAVLSPGKNRKGGFSMEGTQIAACNGTTADTANCDFLTGQAQAVFNSNPYSEAANAGDYFDDFISFNKQPEERALWRRGLTENTENPNDLISMAENKIIVGAQKRINANDGRLSILYDPTNSDFDGSLYVRGALQTKRICDEDNSNCQDVSGLTRDCTGPGEYVIGFYNGRPQCGSIYFGCKEGQILTGISPSGDPTCTNAPLAPQDGQCGSAAGTTIPTAPSGDTALCRRGDATAVNEGTDNFTWRCTGLNNGQTANCSAAKTPPPYNGVCGADNGRTLASAPTARCSVGTESGFSGSGPWTWTCLGEGAGSQNANCSAQRTPPTSCECGPGNCGVVATNGVCNNSARNTCSAGSPANGGETSTHYTWHCNGLNGGANATNCQMAKPVTPQCIPTGQPVPPGQTQCPTNSCFLQVSGGSLAPAGVGAQDDLFTPRYTRAGGGNNMDYLGEIVGPGVYERASPFNGYTGTGDFRNPTPYSNSVYPFLHADAYTFDSMVIGPTTNVIIYRGPGQTGGIRYQAHGPKVLYNVQWRNGTAASFNADWGVHQSTYPQSVREWSTTNMQDWGRNGAGITVTCDP